LLNLSSSFGAGPPAVLAILERHDAIVPAVGVARLIRFEGGSSAKWGSKSNDGRRFAVIE
jgi:hypothetical protein